jgi:hypothetical protein
MGSLQSRKLDLAIMAAHVAISREKHRFPLLCQSFRPLSQIMTNLVISHPPTPLPVITVGMDFND